MTAFKDELEAGYGFTDPAIVLGAAVHENVVFPEPRVKIPLAMMNRHGLIAGATGTGKTRTLQMITEQLSASGVPVFVCDIKGDLSGIAAPGESNEKIASRMKDIGMEWAPYAVPVEFVSLSGKLGPQLRATVSSFGPLLLSKVLDLNDTQTSVLSLVFKFADQNRLPLLDFDDLRSVLHYLTSDEGKAALRQYGGISAQSVGVLLRKMVELEQQGARDFFGEPEFDVRDLLHVTLDGRGVVTCLEVADVQDKPKLFSTFMMWLLAELYQTLPEAGDLAKPKLCFFFDEAHLLFDDASKAFLDQIEQVVRLIRSKGVGVYFVTQTPKDVSEGVLAQLGNRIQHALRAFTPRDDAALRATARTFPRTAFYDLEETLTTLGVGEAVVTVLDPRGVPTPAVATRLRLPGGRMTPLTPAELEADIQSSDFLAAYGTPINRESAHEILARRLTAAAVPSGPAPDVPPAEASARGGGVIGKVAKVAGSAVVGALASNIGRTVGRELVRGLFGMLGARPPRGTTRRRR
ncbi:MAG: helicase HerA-like domain-containing protein [Gemmatimonadota bacterium]